MPRSSDPDQSEPTGLYGKYEVTKDGEPIDGDVFVLRPDRDSAARVALLAYAAATDDYELRNHLHKWVATLNDETAEMGSLKLRVEVAERSVADATVREERARREALEASGTLTFYRDVLRRAQEEAE